MRSIFNNMIKVIYGIFIAILTIGISTIMALNSQFIYHYSINKYSLDKLGNISKEMLIKDFNTLIKYLQNPFIEKLKFNNFPMSINGEFHFYEVKRIFLFIYGITIFIALLFIVLFIVNRIIGKKIYFYKILNYGANTLIFIIISFLSAIFIDFSKAFVVFHKIFFNNDYWIFDERTDPIIKVLPEEVFMLYSIVIIVLVIFSIILYKLYYYYSKNKLKN
ncbi:MULTISPECIES: TIGR01906 family membrane protein [unclassified Clostridium]|uniref:TIGR01906 family membrane protein n=1 Tax=unclassified Clostridium TaxID=2614128 RepID=UPI0025C5B1CB|nr:TIGR01906 family membrane protein [Clostridium sp.]MDY2631109.1 TIGR01906 family membrane protein [Clostridium sp.]MDY4251835.1 TIGR01906 family membrane protein [Clostridium sp.]